MRQRQWIALAAFVALALGVGYFVGRSAPRAGATMQVSEPTSAIGGAAEHDSVVASVARIRMRETASASASAAAALRAALPPPGAPLAQTFDELRIRADDGDTQAASRLFHDLERCRAMQKMSRYAPGIGYYLDHSLKPATPEEVTQQERFLAQAQHTLDLIQQNQALCSGIEPSQLEAIVPVMFEAAQGGDRRALNCYVGADFTSMPGLLEHPEWLTQYKQNAMALAQTAYQQGDWVAVGLLQQAHAGVFEASLLGQLLGADPDQAYRYLKLQRLGATGDFVAQLDEQLAEAEKTLSKQQIAEADAWAHGAYAEYFNNSSSNELSNGVNVCGSIDD